MASLYAVHHRWLRFALTANRGHNAQLLTATDEFYRPWFVRRLLRLVGEGAALDTFLSKSCGKLGMSLDGGKA